MSTQQESDAQGNPQEQPQVEQWDGFSDDEHVLNRIWAKLRKQGVQTDPVKKPSEKKQQDNQP